MTKSDFEVLMNKLPFGNYLVSIKCKYSHEDEYEELNELLTVDVDRIFWENDWDEGQQDVNILGIISLDDVFVPYNLMGEEPEVPLFENRMERRKVNETMSSLLCPLKNHLNKATVECVDIAMHILSLTGCKRNE